MEKVDIAIAAVGAFALLATGLGVAFYDDLNNLNDYTVEASMVDFTAGGDVPGGVASFDVDVPENMYHAIMDVTVNFASQNPAASCTINVLVRAIAPDGTEVVETSDFEFSSGAGVVHIETEKFGEEPEDFKGTADDKAAKTLTWDAPLTVELEIQDTGCGAPVLGVGGATYTADIAGQFHGFSIAGGEPDVGAL